MTETSSGKFKNFRTVNYVCIEYPGYIKNVDSMLKTLGGEEHLSDTYFNTKRRIELHLRPHDPYCHSVCGDLEPSRALLLKVKRKRKQKKAIDGPENDWVYEQEVLGVVQNTYRGFLQVLPFRNKLASVLDKRCISSPGTLPTPTQHGRFSSLMDFQYLTPEPLQNAFSAVMTSSLLDEKQPLHIVPAIFSRIDVQGSYNYHPEAASRFGTKGNPSQVATTEFAEEVSEQISDTRMRKRRPSEALGAIFSSKEVPQEPGAKCKELIESMQQKFPWVKKSIKELSELFKKRPMWSRTAITYHMGSEIKKERLKQILPYVAYYWLNGPWRALWTVFGYDPRKFPEAMKYQICDFRLRNRKGSKQMPIVPLRSSKICILPVQMHRYKNSAVNVDTSNEEKPTSAEEEDSELPYTFHADKLPRARQVMYQLCDIYDDDVQAIISENDGKEKKCTAKDGWFGPTAINRIRACLVTKVDLRIEKELENKDQKEDQSKEKLNDENNLEGVTEFADETMDDDDEDYDFVGDL